MNKNVLDNICFYDVETTGIPSKGAKWDEDFETFPNIVQIAWVINGKERSFIIYPEFWSIPEESIAIHGITQLKALENGVRFADIIGEFIEDCLKARLLIGHNIYFDTSIIKAMILRLMGKEYYESKNVEDALFKGKRIDTMMKTIKFVGALKENGKPGKFPKLSELYEKLFPGEQFPAHNALDDVRALVRCVPVLVDKGVIELKPKEYEPEQLKVKFEKETKPTKKTKKTKKVKRSIEFNDPSPVLTPINSVPEVVDDTSTNVKALLGENDF